MRVSQYHCDNMKDNDIVVYSTLFGDFEATNVGNYFNPRGFNPLQCVQFSAERGFKTAEDCKKFIIEELEPLEGIDVWCV